MPKRDVKVPAFIWAVKTSIQALCDYFAHMFVPVNFPSHEGFSGCPRVGKPACAKVPVRRKTAVRKKAATPFKASGEESLPGTSLLAGKTGAVYAWEVFLS